jgi:glucose/arabinose dehydrogenase/plastocyanin
MRRRYLTTGITAAGMVAATLVAGTVPAAHAAAPKRITTLAFQYLPPTLRVPTGGAMRYTNLDLVPHNVRSTDGLFTSGSPIGPLQSRPVQGVGNLAPGRYKYFCEVHPFMTGTLVVGNGGGGSPPVEPPEIPSPPIATGGLPVGLVPTPTSLTAFAGSLYVASWGAGVVFRLPLLPLGLLGPPLPYATGFHNPLGIAFNPSDGTMFVADSHASSRPGRTTEGRVWAVARSGTHAKSVVIDGLPNGRHNTNGMVVHAGRLLITNGNSTDDGVDGGDPEEPLSGTVLSVPVGARGLHIPPPPASPPPSVSVVARGMRNVYDVAVRPGTAEAWITMNGLDAQEPFGEDLLLRAPIGGVVEDFGFPGCVYASNPFRVVQNRNPRVTDVCDGTEVAPATLLGLHVSADGIAFGPGGVWGRDAYIALFGSNPGEVTSGRRVVRVPVSATGVVTGAPRTIRSGGSPLDLAFGPAGLYVGDFLTGTISLLRAP